MRSLVVWGALLGGVVAVGCGGSAHNGGSAQGGNGGNGGNAGEHSTNEGGEAGESVIDNAGEGGGGGAAPVDSHRLGGSAWDVTLSVKYASPPGFEQAPAVFPLSLAIDDTASLKAILSAGGKGSALALTRDSETRAHLEAPESGVGLPVVVFQTVADGSLRYPLTAHELTLTAFDDDADGVADRLEGNGEGVLGEDEVPVPATFTISGRPDRSPPKLTFAPILTPLEQLTVTVNEALEAPELELQGTSNVPLTDAEDSLHSRFFSQTVLPFGGAWQITGHGKDFAGLLLDLSAASIKTIDDPGVFAQDGFETEPLASVGEGVKWIDASSGLPIPSGSHALLLPPRGAAIFHLKRTENSSKVSLSAVGLSGSKTEIGLVGFQAAVIGGTERIEQQSATSGVQSPTSHATWTKASAPSTFEFELRDSGPDVVVEIYPGGGCLGFGCLPTGALVIDDLHIE